MTPTAAVNCTLRLSQALAVGALSLVSMSALAASGVSMKSGTVGTRALVEKSELSVTLVDLTDADKAGIDQPLADVERDPEGGAPYLYLAPRIESILEDVFAEDDTNEDEVGDSAMTRLAETSDDRLPATEAVDTEESADVEPVVLEIKREMYRTDI